MTKIGSIYVEVRGDYTQFQQDLLNVRSTAKKSGTEISDALNNSIDPKKASRGVSSLSRDLMQLAASARVPGQNFRATANALSTDLTRVAERAGMTKQQFAQLNERMLRTQAARNAELALRRIARAAGLSRDEMRRLGRQMGMTTKALDNMDARTKSTSAGFQTMARSIAFAAKAYLSYRALQVAKDATLIAARYETLGVVMRVIGENAGYSADQMERFARGLQSTGISMVESRQSLARMAKAHLDLAKATDLARVAQDAAVIGNINSSEAFERMIYGIQSAQVRVLRTIGLNVSFENSYQKVAKATGRATTEFSEAEKAIIRMNAVLEAGKSIGGTYEAAMETTGKKIGSLTRYHQDLGVEIGRTWSREFNSAVDAYTWAVKAAGTALKDFNDEQERTRRLREEGFPQFDTEGLASMLDPMGTSARMISNWIVRQVFGDQAEEILNDQSRFRAEIDRTKRRKWEAEPFDWEKFIEGRKQLVKAFKDSPDLRLFDARRTQDELETISTMNKFYMEKAGNDFQAILQKNVDLVKAFQSDPDLRLFDARRFADPIETMNAIQKATDETTETTKTALEEYAESAKLTAEDIEDAMVNSLTSIEDFFVKLTTEGSFAFASMVDSILADLTRLTVRQGITGPLAEMMSGAGGGEGVFSWLKSMFGGFKASGGPLEQNKWYIAGERGPEPVWGGGSGAFASGYGGGGQMTMRHEVTNKTGAPVKASLNRVTRKEHEMVADWVLENVNANGKLAPLMRK